VGGAGTVVGGGGKKGGSSASVGSVGKGGTASAVPIKSKSLYSPSGGVFDCAYILF
jgi:hypothetical protein